MARCKDCLHHEVCSVHPITYRYDDLIGCVNVETNCQFFKAKARYFHVPVNVGEFVEMNQSGKSLLIRIWSVNILEGYACGQDVDLKEYVLPFKDFGINIFIANPVNHRILKEE